MSGPVNVLRSRPEAKVIAFVCGLLLILPGCNIPKLRQAQTGLAVPPSFNGVTSSENSAQLRVDEFYKDPILTRVICQAVANNRQLRVLEQEVQIARNVILQRRGAFLPFIGVRALGGMDQYSQFTLEGASRQDDPYVHSPDKLLPNPVPNTMLGLNLFWQLDIWRELRNARDAAIQRYFEAIERRNYFVTRMVADIAENYYALLALDRRLENLDIIIGIQEKSLAVAEAIREAGRSSVLPVQRFRAEVRKNQSEKLIIGQEIIQVENRINFLAGRVPQQVERESTRFLDFLDLNINTLNVGVPAQLLQNRPDIRQAERELTAAGLDVKVARAHFFPRLDITAGYGYQSFNPKYLFMTPQAMIANAAADLTAPLINKAAIRADYMTANAKQLEAIYDYQRVILNAYTEVINQLTKVVFYARSIEIKKQQLASLEAAVASASDLYQNQRIGGKSEIDYLDVLTAQRDLLDVRMVLISTKREQLSAIVNTYQALGGGSLIACPPADQTLGAPVQQQFPAAFQSTDPQHLLPVPRKIEIAPEPRRLPDVPQPEQPGPKPPGKLPASPMALAPAPVEWVRAQQSVLLLNGK
jgi:multidrug efflux system outer membrane protein